MSDINEIVGVIAGERSCRRRRRGRRQCLQSRHRILHRRRRPCHRRRQRLRRDGRHRRDQHRQQSVDKLPRPEQPERGRHRDERPRHHEQRRRAATSRPCRAQGQVNTPMLANMNLHGSGSQSVQGMDPSLSGVRTASLGTEGGFHGVAVAVVEPRRDPHLHDKPCRRRRRGRGIGRGRRRQCDHQGLYRR